ncbi:MAG: lipoyl(octanoyl) transferase LipB [Anaerolineales bacterium]
MSARCEIRYLGIVDYLQAWRLQAQYADAIACNEVPPTLLLLQHPHTFTFGRRGKPEHLLWNAAECAANGVQVHWVDRGGDVTYHGPGQLVGYPLLPLGQVDAAGRLADADYVGYVRRLERVLLGALATFGVTAHTQTGKTGVWVTPKGCSESAKIAAIGIKVDAHGITRHGFALNINPDMRYWQGIVGCGLHGDKVTSLAELLPIVPDFQSVMIAVRDAFVNEFNLFFDEFSMEVLPNGC